MNEQTMYELLEIRDAVEQLREIELRMTGAMTAVEPGEGIMGDLSYVDEIITRHSPLFIPGTDYEKTLFGKVLEDTEIDNHRKARILLGIETYEYPN